MSQREEPPLIDQANWLMRHTIAYTKASMPLDETSTQWLIRMDAWEDMILSTPPTQVHVIREGAENRSLMDIPVRLTVDDAETTPAIQLVMTPQMRAGNR